MIVSLDTAKTHLGLTDDDRNTDVLEMLAQAEAVVLAYLARPSDATWTAMLASWGVAAGSPPTIVEAPAQVRRAILVQVAEFDRYRGDDGETWQEKDSSTGNLSPMVKSALIGLKIPVFA